jgi:hypothetical protein
MPCCSARSVIESKATVVGHSSVVVSPVGSAVTEDNGPDDVHIVRNLGQDPLVLWVDYIKPAGAPLSVEAPDPGCGT